MFRVSIELLDEQLHLGALGIGEEAAPALFARFETGGTGCALSRGECRRCSGTHLRVHARVLRRDAEEAAASAPVALLIKSFFFLEFWQRILFLFFMVNAGDDCVSKCERTYRSLIILLLFVFVKMDQSGKR